MYTNQSSGSGAFKSAPTVERASSAVVTTHVGDVCVVVFTEPGSRCEHVAFVHGQVANQPDVPVCMRAHVSERDACEPVWHDQLQRALALLENEERGVLVFLRRPSGLEPESSDLGRTADERDYVIAADILRDLRVRSVRLMGVASH